MSTNENTQGDQQDNLDEANQEDNADEAIGFKAVSEFFWDFINDPAEAQIEAQIRAQIAAQQIGTSNQHRRLPRRHIDRDREGGRDRLMADYFVENPRYTDKQFRRRFRMRKHLFRQIVETLSEWSPYFRQRSDAFGKPGFSPLHKCTAAIRMLAYGTPADLFDENLRMAESTVIECMITFCKGVIQNFSPKFLRRPTSEDIQRLLVVGEARGFPGMLGSLDCMHWTWRNCPVAHKGMFTRGDHGVATVMLEAVASEDLWIWHAFFGVAGSSNDLNVLDQSTLFTQVVQGVAPEVHFEVKGHEYNLGYYLVDGIYPEWATFVKSIPMAQSEKDKLYKAHQEGARKDVERAFGVLQARFAIVRNPGRMQHRDALAEIMYACIILHNMIVADERHTYKCYDRYDCDYEEADFSVPYITAEQGPVDGFDLVLEKEAALRDRATHRRLKADLVENIWDKFGGNAV